MTARELQEHRRRLEQERQARIADVIVRAPAFLEAYERLCREHGLMVVGGGCCCDEPCVWTIEADDIPGHINAIRVGTGLGIIIE